MTSSLTFADFLQAPALFPGITRSDVTEVLHAVTGLSLSHIRLYPDKSLSPSGQQQVIAFLHRLAQDEPLAYILGYQYFWQRKFSVTPDVLIPRPDTEHLVAACLARFPSTAALQIADLGTGSGCVAITLALEFPASRVMATDRSLPALHVAARNSADHQADILFKQQNWLDGETRQFDLIVSNPPYIAPYDQHLPQLADEPVGALVAPQYGLADIQTIIATAPACLHAGGWLMLEHGFDQGAAVRSLFVARGFKQVATLRDFGQNERITLGSWGRSLCGGEHP